MFPAVESEALVSLLAKPDGGFRPIVLFRGLYPLWGESRSGLAKAWLNGLGSAVINMQAGGHIPDGIWRRLTRGGNLRRHVAEIDLDLRKALCFAPLQ